MEKKSNMGNGKSNKSMGSTSKQKTDDDDGDNENMDADQLIKNNDDEKHEYELALIIECSLKRIPLNWKRRKQWHV